MKHERIVQRSAEGVLKTDLGEFRIYSYRKLDRSETHVALVYGPPSEREWPSSACTPAAPSGMFSVPRNAIAARFCRPRWSAS